MRRIKPKYFLEFIIHALFWVAVYYALRALTVSSIRVLVRRDGASEGHMEMTTLFPYSTIVLGSLMLLFYGNIFWIFKKVLRYKSNFLRLTIIAGWSVFLFIGTYILIHSLIPVTPIAKLPTSLTRGTVYSFTMKDHNGNIFHPRTDTVPPPPDFRSLTHSASDDWSHMQPLMILIFLSVLGISLAYFFINERMQKELIQRQIEANQLSTEIKFLRSQVNPHFLFNTLNNLFSMAQKKGDEDLADGISKLSDMMRYMIYESNTDKVPLTKEIQYLEDCIALNKLRYADDEVRVIFTHPSPAAIASVKIEPMLFIPFLENAFKHGVSIGQNSCIDMSVTASGKKLVFTCENTDQSAVKKLDEENAGIGLENVKRRLELLYPARHELTARPQSGKYVVNLQIDLS